jgi:hypothetical protein
MKALALVLALALPARSWSAPDRVPVLLELFTSEGCSSCPPADATLQHLEKEQPLAGAEIIPLAWHVDYWDRLGWKDRFASARFSQRQYDYAQAKGWDQVYTPQAIVQGQDQAVGSDREGLEGLLRRAAQRPVTRLQVSLRRTAQGLRVQVRGAVAGAALDLALVESGLRTQVQRGENEGVTLEHADVVRAFTQRLSPTAAVASWDLAPGGLALEAGPLKAVAWQPTTAMVCVSVGQSPAIPGSP